jgi:FAS-associated factor 2
LISHLTNQLLPRVLPFLERTRAAQRERERDRALREEQDRAFAETAQRDGERIQERMRKDAEEAAAKSAADEAKRIDEAIAKSLEEDKERRAQQVRDRRRWERKCMRFEDFEGRGAVRVAVSLPGSQRLIRKFDPASALSELFKYVDVQLLAADSKDGVEAEKAPPGYAATDEEIEAQVRRDHSNAEEWWGFKLVTAYPREEIPWKRGAKIADVKALQGGGSIVVEPFVDNRTSSIRSEDEDDDGYVSED